METYKPKCKLKRVELITPTKHYRSVLLISLSRTKILCFGSDGFIKFVSFNFYAETVLPHFRGKSYEGGTNK